MKTKVLALLVIFSFAFFSCQKNDQSTSADQNASLLKSTTIAVIPNSYCVIWDKYIIKLNLKMKRRDWFTGL